MSFEERKYEEWPEKKFINVDWGPIQWMKNWQVNVLVICCDDLDTTQREEILITEKKQTH